MTRAELTKRLKALASADRKTYLDTMSNIERMLDQIPAAWWSSIEYFTPKETACRCCGANDMEIDVMRAADTLRKKFNVPGRVSSGYRCAKHNREVGGAANSRHLSGKALDISFDGVSSQKALEAAKRLPGIRYAYAIDGSHIHMDTY